MTYKGWETVTEADLRRGRPSRQLPGSKLATQDPRDPFLLLLEAHGLPLPQTEYVFLPDRKFRADYCWPAYKLIVEKNGQLFTKGGHSSGRGILRDYEKSNLAQIAGFIFLTFTPQQLESGAPLATLKILFESRR